jgi:hypothetical protein
MRITWILVSDALDLAPKKPPPQRKIQGKKYYMVLYVDQGNTLIEDEDDEPCTG